MKIDFKVSKKDYLLIKNILEKYLVDTKVYIFGSRAKNTAKFNSDIDLALQKGSQKISQDTLLDLKEEFNDSDLAYEVDIVDLNSISQGFKRLIKKDMKDFIIAESIYSSQFKVPDLRFKEFNGEWGEKKLGEVGKVSMCKRVLKDQTDSFGEIPFYKIGTFGKQADAFITKELYNEYKSKYSYPSIGDILISASGTIGRTVVYDGKPAYYQDSNIVWIANNEKFVYNKFLLYCYLTVRWQTEDTTIARLYNENLRKIKINLPSKPEQQKIASFLTSVDKKIELLTQKEKLLKDYKNGIMQKIFSQEIRFKADNDSEFPEWVEKKLGDVLDYEQPTKYIVESTEYNSSYDIPVLTAGKSFILGYTNEKNGVYKNIPVIIFDDFTTSNNFVKFEFKVKSSAMKILKNKNDSINIKFVYESMQMLHFPIGEHKRYWISEYSCLKIKLPCLEEQIKIASFLSAIDNKIEQVAKQLEHTKEFKKGLLQQMFV